MTLDEVLIEIDRQLCVANDRLVQSNYQFIHNHIDEDYFRYLAYQQINDIKAITSERDQLLEIFRTDQISVDTGEKKKLTVKRIKEALNERLSKETEPCT